MQDRRYSWTSSGWCGYGDDGGLGSLSESEDVLVDKESDTLIICDRTNYRVLRWSRRFGTNRGEILLSNLNCGGLAMDDDRNLYVSNQDLAEVRRYELGDENGTIVAGGHGEGNGLHQFNRPAFMFVDQHRNLYVVDRDNNRVMKWCKDATEGIVVAGGHGVGNALTQLSFPGGVVVDHLGTVYIVDRFNNRVMRWPRGSESGAILVDRSTLLSEWASFFYPSSLCFDRYGRLYVTDFLNNGVLRFRYEDNGQINRQNDASIV